jgi:hypothetical protein
MIRNRKALIAGAMVLVAAGVLGASGVQAAEFHCSVEPCRATLKADGSGKSAHHVFIVKQGTASAAATCNTLTGETTSSKSSAGDLTFTNLKYEGCSVAGEPSEVAMNGCTYLVNASGGVSVACEAGKAIEIKVLASGCTFKVGAQALAGLAFKDTGSPSTNTAEITVETKVAGAVGSANSKCVSLGIVEGAVTGEYATANMLVTGESDPGGSMANVAQLSLPPAPTGRPSSRFQ